MRERKGRFVSRTSSLAQSTELRRWNFSNWRTPPRTAPKLLYMRWVCYDIYVYVYIYTPKEIHTKRPLESPPFATVRCAPSFRQLSTDIITTRVIFIYLYICVGVCVGMCVCVFVCVWYFFVMREGPSAYCNTEDDLVEAKFDRKFVTVSLLFPFLVLPSRQHRHRPTLATILRT